MAKTTKTTCAYCGVGCGVLATTHDDGSVSVAGDPEHPANFGRLCSKGSALADTIGLEGRLLHPEVNGQQTSWDEALSHVSDGFNKIIAEHGPDAVAFYASGQLLTEDYYVANKLMKGFIGSANIDTNSRLCMASAVVGYKRAFGADAVPCSYEDLELADLIVIEGSNTAWCHPIVFQRIVKAKEERPDLKVIVIDPRRTATCDIADLHLPIKSGTDVALFNGLLQHLNQHSFINPDYIENYTEGFGDALLTAQQCDIANVAETCGLSEHDILEFYQSFAATEKVVTLYSQGVNQSSSGTDNSSSIINCHLAKGAIGKPGAGPFSITGQPNAMGGREVGGLSNQLAAHMELGNAEHHDLVSRFWNTENLAKHAGAKAVDMFNDVASGKIKAIWIMATNPVVSLPDADKVKAALEKCELVVISDCDKHTDTTEYANVLLPAQGWGEKDGIVTNSERRMSHQRQFLSVAGEAKPDWWIVCEVAKRMGFEQAFSYQSQVDIFREHAALSSFENNGARDFDLGAMAKISNDAYDSLEPIQWPVTATQANGTARLFTDNQFFTANAKAQFVPVSFTRPVNEPTAEYPLILNTGRVRDQWHTMTRTARSARLNGHVAEPFLEIHPDDAQSHKIEGGALAQVDSQWGKAIVRVQISSEQRKGSVFVPMHWNAQYASLARVDALVNPVVDPISGQPEFKHTPVKVRPYRPSWHGFILSRTAINVTDSQYWVKIKGEQFWRYELAGEENISEPEQWSRNQLGDNGEWLEFSDSAKSSYRAAKVVDEKIESVIFLSPTHDLPMRTWLSRQFSEEQLTDEVRMGLLSGKPGAGVPDVGPIVCACFGVGENTIRDAVNCGDAKTVDDIGSLLKAGTNCGSCIPELKKIIGRK
ncbi:nitrate reductase [Methylophaga sp. 42_25_T18]|nr:nitrate reductase [Methylophaga sp. 42_25_T18]